MVDVTELLVDHQSKDAHLGCAFVVQLDGAILHLCCVTQVNPSKVQGTTAEVSLELGRFFAKAKGIQLRAPWRLIDPGWQPPSIRVNANSSMLLVRITITSAVKKSEDVKKLECLIRQFSLGGYGDLPSVCPGKGPGDFFWFPSNRTGDR